MDYCLLVRVTRAFNYRPTIDPLRWGILHRPIRTNARHTVQKGRVWESAEWLGSVFSIPADPNLFIPNIMLDFGISRVLKSSSWTNHKDTRCPHSRGAQSRGVGSCTRSVSSAFLPAVPSEEVPWKLFSPPPEVHPQPTYSYLRSSTVAVEVIA